MIKNAQYVRSKINKVTAMESAGIDIFIEELLIPQLTKTRQNTAKFNIVDIQYHLDKYELSVERLLFILTKRGFSVGILENLQISIGVPPGPD